mmetsp:Transcript_22315/g.54049  ORF Transcript_22315/g.54049 Transcript_22315/m.54049 type:complete len:205 (-) Transcript_22315:1517-2131(-)
MVVSHSCLGIISPRPLNRCIMTFPSDRSSSVMGSSSWMPNISRRYWSFSSSENVYFSILALPEPVIVLYSGGCAMYKYPLSTNSLWYRKKNVNSSTRICAPSTSASVIITIFPYLKDCSSSSLPFIPSPHADINPCSSLFWYILSGAARSILRIFPRRGRMACVRRSRPCFADPAAESPSTMKSSVSENSREEQSASLPGRTVD